MNIVFYSFEKNKTTSYLKSLQKENFNIVGQEDARVVSSTSINAFVIDFSDQKIEDILSYLCGLVLDIRKSQKVPLFIILEKTTALDRRLLLQLGVTKVFDQLTDPSEFSMIISNILKADYIKESSNNTIDNKKDLELIPENLAVRVEAEQETQLTRLEYKFLDYLQQAKGKTASYEELIRAIWGDNVMNGHTRISNIVFHLRKKIEKDPATPRYLKTIYGKGYRLNEECQ